MDDFSVIQRIKGGDNSELLVIYKKFRLEFLNWAVKKYGCSFEDSKDIYQHTILIFFEKVTQEKLNFLTSSIKTYLFAIGKNLILEHLKRIGKLKPETEIEPGFEIFTFKETKLEEEQKYRLVEECLEQLGEPCRTLLISYYYNKKTMQEIADSLGYKNADTVKNSKYKCLQRLKRLYEENS